MISEFYSFWVYSSIIYYGYTCRICRIWGNSNWKIFRKNIWFREVILFKCMLFRYKGCGKCKPCAMYVGTWRILIHLPYLVWYMNVYSIYNVYFKKKSSQDSTHFHLSNQQLSFDTKLFMIKINLISALPKNCSSVLRNVVCFTSSVISRCRQSGRLKPFLLFDVQDSQEALSQTTG